MLIIADSPLMFTIVQKCFPIGQGFEELFSVFKWHGLEICSTNCVYIGNRVILKLENTKHTFLFMSSIRFCSESAFLCWQFTEKLQQILFSVVVPAWSFISLYKSHIDSRKLHFYYLYLPNLSQLKQIATELSLI